MSNLPKPVLRGHMKKSGMMALFGAVGFATLNCALLHFLYIAPKHKRFEDFYKSYDLNAHTKDLIKWGYFQTVRPQDFKQ